MPWYLIDIDGIKHVGEYNGADNAVFGAMRKLSPHKLDKLDKCLIGVEILPQYSHKNYGSKAAYTRHLRKTLVS